jgi:hypothetical protein
MLAQRSVDNAHVKENLTRITDFIEFAEGIVELIVVVTSQGGYPGLDFLYKQTTSAYDTLLPPGTDCTVETDLFQRHRGYL